MRVCMRISAYFLEGEVVVSSSRRMFVMIVDKSFQVTNCVTSGAERSEATELRRSIVRLEGENDLAHDGPSTR